MTKTSFGDQLQQMWQTRPVRLPRQGPIAGVAAGFGQRYNVDPVLVRVAFVVSMIFGGAGIVLYLLAWLLLNKAHDQASATQALTGKGHGSQSPTRTIVLIVALAIAVTTMGPVGAGLGGSGVISLALMLAGWWMLHLRHPGLPAAALGSYGAVPGNGRTATGYPGTLFPTGAALRTTPSDFYPPGVPPTGSYTPCTKLPDSYVPDAPVGRAGAETTPQPDDAGTVSTGTGDADTAPVGKADTGTAPLGNTSDSDIIDKADAETALLDNNTATLATDTGDAETVLLDKPTHLDAEAPPSASDSAAGARPTHPAPTDPAHTPLLDKTTGTPPEAPSDFGVRPSKSPPGTGSSALPRVPTHPIPSTIAGPAPPAWDPLGVAPLAWDLPAPPPARTMVQPQPKRPRSRLTPVVIGLAILTAAGAGAAAASGVDWMTPGRIGAAALAVIGLGLVLGAFLRRGYGLLVLTAPLAGFVLLASLAGPIEFDRGAMGEHVWTPTSMTDLRTSYTVNMGSGTLDLRSLKLTENRTINLSIRMADARVLLPEGMTVDTECTVAMGDAQCPNRISGPNTHGAPVLDLNVDVRTGSVEVHRG